MRTKPKNGATLAKSKRKKNNQAADNLNRRLIVEMQKHALNDTALKYFSVGKYLGHFSMQQPHKWII